MPVIKSLTCFHTVLIHPWYLCVHPLCTKNVCNKSECAKKKEGNQWCLQLFFLQPEGQQVCVSVSVWFLLPGGSAEGIRASMVKETRPDCITRRPLTPTSILIPTEALSPAPWLTAVMACQRPPRTPPPSTPAWWCLGGQECFYTFDLLLPSAANIQPTSEFSLFAETSLRSKYSVLPLENTACPRICFWSKRFVK